MEVVSHQPLGVRFDKYMEQGDLVGVTYLVFPKAFDKDLCSLSSYGLTG